MIKIKIPEKLPNCELFNILSEKIGERHNTDFNFLGRLDDFRQRVSGEARYINQLFPEYTPHDEEYHLKRLFYVADAILGKDRLQSMNSSELFVLACALYGHDWGMAVSNSEKEYILTGKISNELHDNDLRILSNEQDRFKKFARERRLLIDGNKNLVNEISIETWREYIRQTHAFRSGERVRRFFEAFDGGVAEAVSRVCVGHWLNFEDLTDYRSYPTDFSVLHETVNLRALAVYVRLIDLLDLAQDRTPYVIWKFVAPRDSYSKMEWAKHRALQPVTFPQYQEGRIIRVDGSTDNHEVYAALEDLRIWCEEQFRGCNDVLARMNDPRHKLDLYHIDWRVAAQGFKPTSIQFEFDRERMFEILGSEIYQTDPYVFLRELLQNSIDAIRLRREILQRKRIEPKDLGTIYVTVEHGENGDAVITWRDDGIGMDEYIVRNYLAVAGKSYYYSADFEREGLKMDPLSRFGVGILSCFMIADRIEIETFKDPYLPPAGEPLKIIIPSVRRQFRIETLPQENAEVGTTFRIFVEGKKIPVEDENKQNRTNKSLDVTAYLSIVAGFVEFPIVIIEGTSKTIVLHPYQNAETARQRFGEDFNIHQIDLHYPWTKAILPQDLKTAHEELFEEWYDISKDLGLYDYEGALSYLVPIDVEADIEDIGGKWPCEDIQVVKRGQHNTSTKRIRWPDYWTSYHRNHVADENEMSRSWRHSPTYVVYRDGILLSTVSPPENVLAESILIDHLPIPRLIVNIPKSKAPRIDLARTQILGKFSRWDSAIWEAFTQKVLDRSIPSLLQLDPAERLYQLGRLLCFNRIAEESLWQSFSRDNWPLPFLLSGGDIIVLEWQKAVADLIYMLPESLAHETEKIIECKWQSQKQYKGPFLHWNGEKTLIPDDSRKGNTGAIKQMISLYSFAINKLCRFVSIRFLQPPWEGPPPLLQKILQPINVSENPPEIDILLGKITADPTALNAVESKVIIQEFSKLFHEIPDIVVFPKPYEHSFAYGWKTLNSTHAFTQMLLRYIAAFLSSKKQKVLNDEQLGHWQDSILSLPFFNRRYSYEEIPHEEFNNSMHRICKLASNYKLLDNVGGIEDNVLNLEDFVPNTIILKKNGKELESTVNHIELDELEDIRPFGQPLISELT